MQGINEMVNKFRLSVAQGQVDYEDYDKFLKDNAQSYFEVEKPSFLDNTMYMLQYQFGYMYWRYFMWNFTGRQNDIQGRYRILMVTGFRELNLLMKFILVCLKIIYQVM